MPLEVGESRVANVAGITEKPRKAQMNSDHESDGTLDTVRRAARTPHLDVRDIAIEPGSAHKLVAELERLGRQRRSMQQLQRAFGFIAIFGTVLLTFITSHITLYVAVIGLAGVVVARWSTATRYDHTLVRLVKEHGDASSIGPLVNMLKVEGVSHELVTGALTQMLRKLTRSNGHLLTREHRNGLFGELTLREEPDPAFRLALLGALERLGDTEALPYVEELCDSGVGSVRDAAIRCRDTLREIGKVEQDRQTLVRPADGSEELLRPVRTACEEANLLRSEVRE